MNHGMNPRRNFALTPSQRSDARRALALLESVGLSLEQAARLALGKKPTRPRVTVAQVADEFLRSRLADKVRRATFDWYELRINRIADKFGDRIIDEVTRGEFAAWLNGGEWGDASRAGTARAARALWFFALEQDPALVSENITVGLTFDVRPDNPDGSRKFVPVGTVERILKKIGPEYRSAVALMAFAGVRPEEIAGQDKPWLRWEHVQKKERVLRIPAEIAKTGQTRILENLPPSLWAWLTPGDASATVSPVSRRALVAHARTAAGLKAWPHDGLRHSFATYAVAFTSDAAQVALWLGHNGNPTLLHRHYRGLATSADAKRFFSLRPAHD